MSIWWNWKWSLSGAMIDIQELAEGPRLTRNVYVHESAICRARDGKPVALPKGCEVIFDLVRSDKGPQAANLELVVLSSRSLLIRDEVRPTAQLEAQQLVIESGS
jgi:cold shock CspA family protein